MREKRYPVHLSTEQRQELQHLIHAGRSTAHQQMAARVLLKADESNEQPSSSSQIAEALEISPRTVIRIKARFVQQGLATALSGNYPTARPLRRKIDGRVDAHLIALACEPAKPGQNRGEDYSCEKQGQRNLFIACEPLGGKRYLQVTARRTKKDWAHFIEELLTVRYPDARKVLLVMDNLNTHTPTSLYETFPPAKAKGLLDRLEIHYTPKHASWLNIAEIELSVLARQGLEHNIATVHELCEHVHHWQEDRNQPMATVRWQFTTAEARIKLQRWYPTFQDR